MLDDKNVHWLQSQPAAQDKEVLRTNRPHLWMYCSRLGGKS